jgi:multiple sugar transport system permease protein
LPPLAGRQRAYVPRKRPGTFEMTTKSQRGAVGLLYVAPALVFVGAFVLYPIFDLIRMSLTNVSLLGGGEFVGFRNYVRAANDATFWHALGFTAKYTVLITPILIGAGFALALLAAERSSIARLTRAIVFMPVIIGLGSSSLIWVWLFDEQVGLANKVLVDLGFINQPIVWFADGTLGLWAVTVSIVWKVVGYGMLLMLAGIQSLGTDIFEAAMIDGASYWRRVLHITLPLAARTIALTTLVSAIGSMLAFDQFYIMTGGAPRGDTFTAVYWIYQNSFIYFKLGYGAALSVILMTVIFIASGVHIFLTRRGRET